MSPDGADNRRQARPDCPVLTVPTPLTTRRCWVYKTSGSDRLWFCPFICNQSEVRIRMLTPSLNTVMTRLLIVAAVLATAPPAGRSCPQPLRRKGEMVMYAENGDRPGARLSRQPTPRRWEGIHWDVTGVDADRLLHRRSRHAHVQESTPDYENPTDPPYDIGRTGNPEGDTEPVW